MALQHEDSPDNPRAVIGNNSGSSESDIVNETRLANVLRVGQAEYNQAAQAKRHAAEKLRDERNDFKLEQAPVYEEIYAIMSAAKDRMTAKLRARDGYARAEEDKRDASLRMKAALKKLKDAGVDIHAFKIANKMGVEMDAVERQEFFDKVDMYAKGLRLWGHDF